MLTPEDVREFRRICEEELDHPCTEEEALKMANRVIRWLVNTQPEEVTVSDLPSEEQKALEVIKTAKQEGRSPSVREIAKALGFSSSRTGHRVIQILLQKGLVHRDENGLLKCV